MYIKKKYIKKILKPFDIVNKLFFKRNIILIYSNLGFRDNVKSLYDYLIENGYNTNYYIVCSLNDYKKYFNIQINNVKFTSNLNAFFYYFISKYVFYSFGCIPIRPSKKQVVLNLWHGMPLKRIALLENNKINDKFDYFSYVISTSEYFKPIMASAFGCDDKRVLVCGQPRTDQFYLENNISDKLEFYNYKKSVIWMPTFRTSKRLGEFNASNDYNGPMKLDH